MENYNDKDLYIKFYHGGIKDLSDGTLRKLLREYSKLTHEILLDEIDLILSKLKLTYREKQSIRDKIRKQITDKPNYYVEKIEKGSLVVVGLIAGFSVFVLQKTLGKNLEDAWKNSEPGKDAEKNMTNALNTIYKHIKDRPQLIIKKLLPKFRKKIIGDRFQIKEIKQGQNNNENVVTFTIITTVKDIEKKEHIKYDNKYIEDIVFEEIKKIDKEK